MPGCPSIDQISNHQNIQKYVQNKYLIDFKQFEYDNDNDTSLDLANKNAKHALEMAKHIDPDPNNHIYQSLWIGNELSNMEKLSIKSFIDSGHVYHLYTYGEVKGIPDGTIVKDGNDILNEDEIFTYKKWQLLSFLKLIPVCTSI